MITRINLKAIFSSTVAALALLVLQGCATGINAISGNPADPLEPFNRKVFNFNDQLDRAVIKPVALAYRDVTPTLVRRGVTNFFNNISDVWSLANNVLQLHATDATDSLFRVTVNTFWGLGGVFDVASEMNIPRHTEDFGQTLGRWGVEAGPYVVLPVLGPSTVRDSVGTLVDLNGNLVSRSSDIPVRNSLSALGAVNLRANFLGTGDVLDAAALDKYTFTREIYLQRRRSLIGRETTEKEERFDLPETVPAGGSAPAGVVAPVDGANPEPPKSP